MSYSKVKSLSVKKDEDGQYMATGTFAENNVIPLHWVKNKLNVRFETKQEMELHILDLYFRGEFQDGNNKYRLIDDLVRLKDMVPGGWDADAETRRKGLIKGMDLYDELSKDSGKYYIYSEKKDVSFAKFTKYGFKYTYGSMGKKFSRIKAEIAKCGINNREELVNKYGLFKVVGEREKEVETKKLNKSKNQGFGIGD